MFVVVAFTCIRCTMWCKRLHGESQIYQKKYITAPFFQKRGWYFEEFLIDFEGV